MVMPAEKNIIQNDTLSHYPTDTKSPFRRFFLFYLYQESKIFSHAILPVGCNNSE